jgi:hypothetical protein
MSGDHNEYQKDKSYLDFECPRCGHCCYGDEPVVGTKTWFEDGKVVTQNLYASDIYKDEHEPVAWANSFDLQNFDMKVRTGPDLHHTVPLYTEPPKREWQGLTDEEIDECERLATIRHQRHKYSVRGQIITPADGLEWHFAGVIEAKLKEKNA